ncbi:glycosyltransferase [soil metagenome]
MPSLRILYVTSDFPYPLTSGLLRHYFLVKELSRRHTVTLLSIVSPDFASENKEGLAPFTEHIQTFPGVARRSVASKALARARDLLPAALRARTPAGRLGRAGASLIATGGFDVVVLSGKRSYPGLSPLTGLPVVIDMCDAASSRVRGNLRYAAARHKPRLLLEYLEMLRIERRLAEQGDHLLFASARDRDALLSRSPNLRERVPASVLPNGVDLAFWRRTHRQLGHGEVVFTGAMDWPPNEDAAVHLIQAVMPIVWRSAPEARLSVVGHSPRPVLRSAAVDPRVTVTGFVADVRPYLERASVFAAPLRFGAGIQNKVLEAMAMEVPSVVSPLAAAGVLTADGQQPPLVVAADPHEFAAGIVERLVAAKRDPLPDETARRYVEENFTWRRSAELLEDVFDAAVAAAGERERRAP